jgi:hypothetical protein
MPGIVANFANIRDPQFWQKPLLWMLPLSAFESKYFASPRTVTLISGKIIAGI